MIDPDDPYNLEVMTLPELLDRLEHTYGNQGREQVAVEIATRAEDSDEALGVMLSLLRDDPDRLVRLYCLQGLEGSERFAERAIDALAAVLATERDNGILTDALVMAYMRFDRVPGCVKLLPSALRLWDSSDPDVHGQADMAVRAFSGADYEQWSPAQRQRLIAGEHPDDVWKRE